MPVIRGRRGQRGFENDWEIWVFADQLDDAAADDILIVEQLDDAALARLGDGAKVLLMPPAEAVVTESVLGFSSVFWNTAWTNNQAPHTAGHPLRPRPPGADRFPHRVPQQLAMVGASPRRGGHDA